MTLCMKVNELVALRLYKLRYLTVVIEIEILRNFGCIVGWMAGSELFTYI
jgi:hypothetical protein